jgi:ankyrin repeat protein
MKECETYMQLIAYFGAVNCFKQAIMNDAFDIKYISKYAIAGGNNEIVRILEQKGILFDNCFEIGVKYHRMDLCDWLLTHAKCEPISLPKSMEYFNYPAFFFMMNNLKLFDSALSIAINWRNTSIVKYLFEHCHAEVETISATSIIRATEKYNIDIIKYLVEQCQADVNVKDKNGRTPLHIATKKCNIDIVKYLVEQCQANVNVKDKNEVTPLHIAIEKRNIEIIKYLDEQGHADVNTISATSIIRATEKCNIDIIKYLVEQYHANIEEKTNKGDTIISSLGRNCQSLAHS